MRADGDYWSAANYLFMPAKPLALSSSWLSTRKPTGRIGFAQYIDDEVQLGFMRNGPTLV